MSRALASCVFLVALVLPLLNCGSEHKSDEIYYLVAANTKLPYWQMAASGLLRAAAQLHVKAEMVGPDTYDTKGEREAFERIKMSLGARSGKSLFRTGSYTAPK